MRKVMRVHTFAKENNVPSKYILMALEIGGTPLKSASSVIYIDETNRLYYQSIVTQAKRLNLLYNTYAA